MEKFKVCEKEAKTKAFSKEGLQAAASRQDPKEKAKQEMRDWLNTTVDQLNTQIEEFEAEAEDLSNAGGKKKAKPPPRLTLLEESIARHRQHITRLEQMLRLLDNDEITAEDVEGIRDLVDDYIDRNQDDPDEFDVPDDLYADVLEQLETMHEAVVAAPPNHSKAAKDREALKEREKEERERDRQKAAALAAKAQLAAQGNSRLMTETEDDKKPGTPAPVKLMAPAAGSLPPTAAATAVGAVGAPAMMPISAAAAVVAGGVGVVGLTAASAVAGGGLPSQHAGAAPPPLPTTTAVGASAAAPGGGGAAPPPPPPPPPRGPGSKDSPAGMMPTATSSSGPGTPMHVGQGVGTPTAFPLTPSGGATPSQATALPSSQGTLNATSGVGGASANEAFPALGGGGGNGGVNMNVNVNAAAGGSGGKQMAPVGPSLAAATMAAAPPQPAASHAAAAAAAGEEFNGGAIGFDAVAMDGGLEQFAAQLGAMGIQDGIAAYTPAQNLQLLQAAAPRSIPQPSDAQWQRFPIRARPPPVTLPPSYPASRLPVFDNPALFDKLHVETLFLSFYQQPSSHQQYLAARSLKQQAWRFHKQSQAWFQRSTEPKAGGQPGDDWEQGTYDYFDTSLREGEPAGAADAGWCYRTKSDFLFKYSALEDELSV